MPAQDEALKRRLVFEFHTQLGPVPNRLETVNGFEAGVEATLAALRGEKTPPVKERGVCASDAHPYWMTCDQCDPSLRTIGHRLRGASRSLADLLARFGHDKDLLRTAVVNWVNSFDVAITLTDDDEKMAAGAIRDSLVEGYTHNDEHADAVFKALGLKT